jgi:hypothetical protein
VRRLIAPVRGEGSGEREPQPSAVGSRQAQIAPFAARGILFKEGVQNYFARRVLAPLRSPSAEPVVLIPFTAIPFKATPFKATPFKLIPAPAGVTKARSAAIAKGGPMIEAG